MSDLFGGAIATGVGSMPGTDALEAARIVAGELPDFLHVVELPTRGPGADLIGRTAAQLAAVSTDFAVETTPTGWRVAGSVGRTARRAASWLAEDLDALEETAVDYPGPVKGQLAGPWTLCAAIESAGGERLLRDAGAVRDVIAAVAAAAAGQVADLRRRVPAAQQIVIQVDEPGLRGVLDGTIGSASGLSRYAPVDPQRAGQGMAQVVAAIEAAGGIPVAHCCADRPPVDLLVAAGVHAVGVDLLLADGSDERPDLDRQLGTALESGVGLFAGSVASVGVGGVTHAQASAPLRGLLHRLGLADERWIQRVVVTPTCGLAAASPDWARTALSACRAAGRVVRGDVVDGDRGVDH